MREVKQSEAHLLRALVHSETWSVVKRLIAENVEAPLEKQILGGALSHDDYLRYSGQLVGVDKTMTAITSHAGKAKENGA